MVVIELVIFVFAVPTCSSLLSPPGIILKDLVGKHFKIELFSKDLKHAAYPTAGYPQHP